MATSAIIWIAVGIFATADGQEILPSIPFSTEAACKAMIADADVQANAAEQVLVFGHACVPLTIRAKEAAPAPAPAPSLPKMSTPKPGFEVKT